MSEKNTAQITGEHIEAWLKELGGTAATVAKRLQALGIQGDCVSSTTCPVSQYLKVKGFGVTKITTTTSFITVHYTDPTKIFSVGVPVAIERFINNFDSGKYPKLIKQPKPDPSF